MDKQRYVLGFAVTEDGTLVALIKKNRGPVENIGKWNGLGGKVEFGEDPVDAMTREFREESGVEIVPDAWQQIAIMEGRDWYIDVFGVRTDLTRDVVTQEDETVALARVGALLEPERIPTANIVPVLVALAVSPSSFRRPVRFAYDGVNPCRVEG
jgi:8-oxo-dGTP diphosphatase